MTVSRSDLAWFKENERERNAWRTGGKTMDKHPVTHEGKTVAWLNKPKLTDENQADIERHSREQEIAALAKENAELKALLDKLSQ